MGVHVAWDHGEQFDSDMRDQFARTQEVEGPDCESGISGGSTHRATHLIGGWYTGCAWLSKSHEAGPIPAPPEFSPRVAKPGYRICFGSKGSLVQIQPRGPLLMDCAGVGSLKALEKPGNLMG